MTDMSDFNTIIRHCQISQNKLQASESVFCSPAG